jgi:hypothetical protein
MAEIKQIDADALILLKASRPYLRPQQYRTLRGQILSGDANGARKGLNKIMLGGARRGAKA